MIKSYHILIIPSWYPAYPGDIGGSFFREQAIALHKRGHKIGVIMPVVRSLRDYKKLMNNPYGIKYEQDEGVKTYRYYTVNLTPKMPELSKRRWVSLGEKLFEEYVKKNGKPDIIHVHSMINAGFLALKLSNKNKIPYVITEHSSAFSRDLVSKKNLIQLGEVVESSFKNIAVSGAFEKLLNNSFNVNTWSYIPNIVNNEFFNTVLKDDEKKEFTFINVCFLNREKRVDILIYSFAKAFKGKESVKLRIGGAGAAKESLEQLAKELGIENQVVFLGKLTRERVKEEVAKAGAFALSSEYETFGVVLIEALALGKPVIATKCGGPESIVTPQVGYLVEKNSVDEMAKAMLDLYKNQENFKAEEIRQYCIENFSEVAVVKQLEEVYSNISEIKKTHEK